MQHNKNLSSVALPSESEELLIATTTAAMVIDDNNDDSVHEPSEKKNVQYNNGGDDGENNAGGDNDGGNNNNIVHEPSEKNMLDDDGNDNNNNDNIAQEPSEEHVRNKSDDDDGEDDAGEDDDDKNDNSVRELSEKSNARNENPSYMTLPVASEPQTETMAAMVIDDGEPDSAFQLPKCASDDATIATECVLSLSRLRHLAEDLCIRAEAARAETLQQALAIAYEHVVQTVGMSKYNKLQADKEISQKAAMLVRGDDTHHGTRDDIMPRK